MSAVARMPSRMPIASIARCTTRLLRAWRSGGTLATRAAMASTAVVELVGREGPVGEPRRDRLGAGHRVAGQHRLHRPPQAEQPRVPRHVGRAHQAHGRVADLRVLGDVDEVAGRGQLGAAGQAVAVHLGDERRGHVHHLEPALEDVAGPAPVGRGRRPRERFGAVLGQVVAGREAGTGAPDDDHPHLGVGVAGPQLLEQLGPQRVGERVALGGPVEGQAADGRCRVIGQHEARPRLVRRRPCVLGCCVHGRNLTIGSVRSKAAGTRPGPVVDAPPAPERSRCRAVTRRRRRPVPSTSTSTPSAVL